MKSNFEVTTLEEYTFRQFSASYYSGVTKASQRELPAQVPQSLEVSWMSVRNKGHLTLQVENAYVPSPRIEAVSVTWHTALPTHVTAPLQDWSKSVTNKEEFTPEHEKVFRPYYPPHWSGVTETYNPALPAYAIHAVRVWTI